MSNSGLVVRRTERFEISLPARVRVAMHHMDSVQFAKGVTDSDRWIDIEVTDFGLGGVGFVSDLILPRELDLELEIFDIGDQSDQVMMSCQMKVRRVQMIDRRPAYLLGCAFGTIDEETQSGIDLLITRLQGASETQSSGEGE